MGLFSRRVVHIRSVAYLPQVFKDQEDVVATQDEPVEIVPEVVVDVLPDGPTLLPHVVVFFWPLVLDLEPTTAQPPSGKRDIIVARLRANGRRALTRGPRQLAGALPEAQLHVFPARCKSMFFSQMSSH